MCITSHIQPTEPLFSTYSFVMETTRGDFAKLLLDSVLFASSHLVKNLNSGLALDGTPLAWARKSGINITRPEEAITVFDSPFRGSSTHWKLTRYTLGFIICLRKPDGNYYDPLDPIFRQEVMNHVQQVAHAFNSSATSLCQQQPEWCNQCPAPPLGWFECYVQYEDEAKTAARVHVGCWGYPTAPPSQTTPSQSGFI
jgi:hypothetical protein